MRLLAPATRIEFIRWRDQRLKILDEESMFLFSGPGLEPKHIFRATFVILFWSDLKLQFGSYEIHARFPSARTTVTILVCHFYSGSLQPTTNLELLNYLKFLKFFACEEQHVLARWQEILSWRDHERSDEDFRFSSGYRSRPELGGPWILRWFST
jgi:hypothetical protein